MAAKKKGRENMMYISTQSDGVFYTVSVNPKNGNQKKELNKYDWKLRKHVPFTLKSIKK